MRLAVLFVVLGLGGLALAQENQTATGDQLEQATLAAALIEYGTASGDALSLLTAVNLMRDLDAPVVDRNSTVPSPDQDGVIGGNALRFYDSSDLIARARDLAGENRELQQLVDQFEENELTGVSALASRCQYAYVWVSTIWGYQYRYRYYCSA